MQKSEIVLSDIQKLNFNKAIKELYLNEDNTRTLDALIAKARAMSHLIELIIKEKSLMDTELYANVFDMYGYGLHEHPEIADIIMGENCYRNESDGCILIGNDSFKINTGERRIKKIAVIEKNKYNHLINTLFCCGPHIEGTYRIYSYNDKTNSFRVLSNDITGKVWIGTNNELMILKRIS